MDAYEFKPLSEVEQIGEPGTTTTVLVLDNGEVKQLPAATLGGSAVSGSFIVNITVGSDSEGVISSVAGDKTYDEISAAVSAGIIPDSLIHGYMMLEVAHGAWVGKLKADYGSLHAFSVQAGNLSVAVGVSSDNVWGAL